MSEAFLTRIFNELYDAGYRVRQTVGEFEEGIHYARSNESGYRFVPTDYIPSEVEGKEVDPETYEKQLEYIAFRRVITKVEEAEQ